MLRRLLVMAVLLGFIQAAHPYPIPASSPNLQHNIYLPLVVNDPPVEVVSLGEVDWIGYPGDVCLYGYVTSITETSYINSFAVLRDESFTIYDQRENRIAKLLC